MPLQIAPMLLVATMAGTAAPVDSTQRVRFETTGSFVWKADYDDDGGGTERRGPGISGSTTLRLTRRLTLGADVAWVHASDPYPSYSESTNSVALTGSLLWHFSNGPLQPYLGIGATHEKSDRCYDGPPEPYCLKATRSSPVLLGGVKFINERSGLIIAPEIRLEYMTMRLGLSVGKVWFRRKLP